MQIIGDEIYLTWSEIENGKYLNCYAKEKGIKLTEEMLEQAVKDRVVKSWEVKINSRTFFVYSEMDIVVGLANYKFRKVIDTRWF